MGGRGISSKVATGSSGGGGADLQKAVEAVESGSVRITDTNVSPGLIYAAIRRKLTGNTDIDIDSSNNYLEGSFTKGLVSDIVKAGIRKVTISALDSIINKNEFIQEFVNKGFEKAGMKPVKLRETDENGNIVEVEALVLQRK